MEDILQSIAQWAAKMPHTPAYTRRGFALTYLQLEERSDALASLLEETCSRTGRPIIVYGHMQLEMPIAFLACVKAGHAYIPVDDSTPVQRLQAILDHSEAELILAVSEIPDGVIHSEVKMLANLSILIATYQGKRPKMNARVQQEDNFYIIYTSGSTGTPKGVQITANCLQSFVSWMNEEFPSTGHAIYLNQAPFSFDLSVMDLYPALVSGGTVWALDREFLGKPAHMFASLAESNVTVWTSTPSFVEFCLRNPLFNQELLPLLRTFQFCGETLSRTCATQLLERFPLATVYNTYGPTEATVAVTAVKIDSQLLTSQSALPVGQCKPDCRILIVDDSNKLLPDGEKGQIVIAGPSVSTGYYRNAELTERAFSTHEDEALGTLRSYRTGDSGFLQKGQLYYVGRLDFQVKLHGYRIELEEIEHQLRHINGLKSAAVLPKWNEQSCEYLTAFIVPDRLPEDEFAWGLAVKKELAQFVPDYMVPRRIVIKDSLPITVNGKIDRKRLAEEV